MTPRAPQASRPAPPPPSRPQRPPSTGRQPIVAPLLAFVGLIAMAAGSFWTLSYLGLTDAAAEPTEPPTAVATPDPSTGLVPSDALPEASPTPHSTIIITPPPDKIATVVGTILVSKQGDIYRVTDQGAKFVPGARSRDARTNTAPTWMPDGKRFLYVQTVEREVQAPYDGRLVKYTFFYPNIMSMPAEGGEPRLVYESLFDLGGGRWHRWVLQPDVSPDGERIAVVTDGRDGFGDVTLGSMTIRGGNLQQFQNVPVAEDGQGHNDPAWSPDGRQIAFTYNARRQNTGVPKIGILTLRSGDVSLLKAGYANPSWSPDGRVIVAERTDGVGRDIVILDPRNGAEIARLTRDGDSFAPTFSPNGDQIAFLKRDGLTVNLWIMTLDPAAGYTRLDVKPVTEDPQGLDAESPPSWFIPEDQLKPLVTPAPNVLPSLAPEPSAGPSASLAP